MCIGVERFALAIAVLESLDAITDHFMIRYYTPNTSHRCCTVVSAGLAHLDIANWVGIPEADGLH